MRTPYRLIVAVIAYLALTACTNLDLIRSSSGPSPSMDHCPVCMDLGQAWTLFRLGDYDQAVEYSTLVIEEEADMNGKHVRRARDISLLSKGYLALRGRDYPTAWAMFRDISDPQLRALGQPYVDSEARYWASGVRARASEEIVLDGEARAACVLPEPPARVPRSTRGSY
jgi:hypothetical protein